MFSALFSFLGGSAFRMIWGEISSFITKRQDNKYEMQRLTLQGDLDAKAHARNLESLRLQSELGVKEVRVKADAEVAVSDAQAFRDAVSNLMKPTGIPWVDIWNGSVRPAFATISLAMWTLALYRQNWVLAAWDLDMIGAISGFYFADRSLGRRGK